MTDLHAAASTGSVAQTVIHGIRLGGDWEEWWFAHHHHEYPFWGSASKLHSHYDAGRSVLGAISAHLASTLRSKGTYPTKLVSGT
ncbi:hypothetical protein VTO73DRAFT_8474 [Trametes versicolor]